MNKKILQYKWGSNSDEILKRSLAELGYEVITYSKVCEHYTKDLGFAQGLINLIHEHDVCGVISNDYFPIISMVCNTVGIPYYSWVYDSPHYTLFASTSKYSCNRIGCFDRALVERLNNLGIDTVFHLPLGVDWSDHSVFGPINDIDVGNKDSCENNKRKDDVSFVGSLYTDKYNYYDNLLDDEILKQKAKGIIKDQLFEYKEDHIKDFFMDGSGNGTDPEIANRAKALIYKNDLFPGDEYIEDIEYIFDSHFLEKKVTVEERRILLNEIAKRDYDLALYTGSDLSKELGLKKVCRGYVDYQREMPEVFLNSRINLNISLRSIKTGIPLRALDIMGCGGFLLSNYQEEFKEFFSEGEELVMFYSLEDCLEKIDYYLEHEDVRKSIAMAGKRAVEERFKYRYQLKRLLDMD